MITMMMMMAMMMMTMMMVMVMMMLMMLLMLMTRGIDIHLDIGPHYLIQHNWHPSKRGPRCAGFK